MNSDTLAHMYGLCCRKAAYLLEASGLSSHRVAVRMEGIPRYKVPGTLEMLNSATMSIIQTSLLCYSKWKNNEIRNTLEISNQAIVKLNNSKNTNIGIPNFLRNTNRKT